MSERRGATTTERLGPGDAGRLRAIRLRALRDAPDAFESSLEEAEARSTESWERDVFEIAAFVATAAGRDIGLVRGTPHDTLTDAGYLISLWVAPEARGEGVGSALVDAVVEWARERGLRRLFLDVGDKNAPAIDLNLRKGFKPNGQSEILPPPREHIREVQMVLRL